MEREERTLEAMIRLHCAARHEPKGDLCPSCEKLFAYAKAKLARCPFQEEKTPCAKCAVHCYKPALREQVREVMRYAGPRMLLRHPVLALLHLLDGFRTPPPRG
jgi:hypothetical protein